MIETVISQKPMGIRFLVAGLLGSTIIGLYPVPSAMAQQTIQLERIVVQSGDNGDENKTSKADELAVDGIVPITSSAGTKSNTPLIRTPQAISTVTSKEMEARSVQNTAEALRYTPGVSSELYGADPRADWVRVRGFGAPEYLDGLKVARGSYAWPRVDPYMLERVEVVRGPSGSLYGQTPPGGFLNLVSKKPKDEAFGEIGLHFGDPRRVQLQTDFGGPLTEDKRLSYRFTGIFRDADTIVDFVNDDRVAVSGALTWKPSNQTTLTILGHQINDDAKALQFLPASGTALFNPNGEIPRNRFTGESDYDKFTREQYGIGYLFDHEFENGVKLSHKLRWSSVDYDLLVVRAFGLLPGSSDTVLRRGVGIFDLTETLSVDTNLSYNLSTDVAEHRLLIGFDYVDQNSDLDFKIGAADSLNIYNPVYGGAIGPLSLNRFDETHELNQVGVYVQDQISWDNWELQLSARHDWFETEVVKNITTFAPAGIGGSEGDQFTWRAGLLHAFDNGFSPYVSFATSFEPLNGLDVSSGESYKPTKSEQVEVGIKYAPPGTNALFTLSAFELKQENTLVSIGLTSTQIGESEVRGLELEGRFETLSGFDVIASYAYLDTEITQGTASTQGKRLPFVPTHQASLWASYDFSGAFDGMNLNGGVRYFGSSFGSASNTIRTDGYTLFDVGMKYDLGEKIPSLEGASLSVSVANLLDEKYVSTCNDVTSCYWGAGRTIRGALVYKW